MNDTIPIPKSFLWGMVTADFFPFRNYSRDYRSDKLADQLRQELGRPDDQFVDRYAILLAYTEDMHFHWTTEAPYQYRALETWWEMVSEGKALAECYLFYTENVDNHATTSFLLARNGAHTLYRPPEARGEDELTPEELDDPNSGSAVTVIE